MRKRCEYQLEGVKRELRDVSNSERGFVEDPLSRCYCSCHHKVCDLGNIPIWIWWLGSPVKGTA